MCARRSKNEEQPSSPSRKLSRKASKTKKKSNDKVKPVNKTTKKVTSLKDDVKVKPRKSKVVTESPEDQRKTSLAEKLSKKVWRLMSHQVFSAIPKNQSPADKLKSDESELKRNKPTAKLRQDNSDINKNKPAYKLKSEDSIIKKFKSRGVGKSKIWESLQQVETAQVGYSGTSSANDDNSRNKKSSLKLKVRKQLWNLSKKALKENEYWKTLLAENNINVDRINIDKVDLSLIDVDGLGIENKFLKRTVTWLLK